MINFRGFITIARRISELKSKMLKFTDARVRLTNEILLGVRAIKSYNWERAFVDQLNDIRNQELDAIRAAANTKALFTAILNAAPSVVAALTLGVYALLGNTLDSTKVFTALALFNQLRFPLIFLPMLFNTLSDGHLSLWRLTGFLRASEIEKYVINEGIASSDAARIEDGCFAWSSSNTSGRGSLNNVNLKLKRGELVAVVGPVGSGKTTLLSALLGELHKNDGNVTVNGRVAYVPQSSWIPNETVRNVILFGKQMNWRRYRNTILACGLSKDLEGFDDGDHTEIGEKGTNLSGGQKQRVSIARAVYDDADIYLFDDPLSALDAEVGLRVFRDCMKNLLCKKTRILVTHQLGILPEVDRVIIMGNSEDGACRIVDEGSFSELLARGHDLSKSFIESPPNSSEDEHSEPQNLNEHILADSYHTYNNDSGSTVHEYREDNRVVESFAPAVGFIDLCHGPECDTVANFDGAESISQREAESLSDSTSDDEKAGIMVGVGTGDAVLAGGFEQAATQDKSDSHPKKSTDVPSKAHVVRLNHSPVRLITPEDKGHGAVSVEVYRKYLRSAKSPLLILGILASFVLANASQIGQQWVVAAWTSDTGYKKLPLVAYLGGVSLMAGLVGLFNWFRTFISVVIGANASRTIHQNLAGNVLRAPLGYFESTPVGRLVQRFSKDLDQIDQQLPSNFAQLMASGLQIVASVVAISVITPMFALYMIPVFGLYFTVTNYYRNAARELKRLESLTRSPIYSHFGESLGGLPVIRSFERQNMYTRVNEGKVDDNLSAYVSMKLADRWLCVRLESLGNIVVFFSALLAVVAGRHGAAAGISLNNALSITSLLNWAVRNIADTEALMNSVERVLYTTEMTPSERPAIIEHINITGLISIPSQSHVPLPTTHSDLVASGWPWKGGITIRDAVMSYRDDFEPVLKGVTLNIEPGERIGIVGRTGSGKSSLLRALLRLTELTEGEVNFTLIM